MCGIVGGQVSQFACCNLHTFDKEDISFPYASGKEIAPLLPKIDIKDIEDLMCD